MSSSNLLLLFKGRAKTLYYQKVMATAPFAYWPLNDISGTVCLEKNGLYNGVYTNVTLGIPGIGNGFTSVSFNGSSSKDNIYSAALSAAFNWDEVTAMIWGKVSGAGVWTDGTRRELLGMANSNSTAWLSIRRHTVNNQLLMDFSGLKTVTYTGPNAEWMCFIVTLSKSANKFQAFCNNVQVGTDGAYGSASPNDLSSTGTLIGASSTVPANIWSGNLDEVALWKRVLSATERASLSTL